MKNIRQFILSSLMIIMVMAPRTSLASSNYDKDISTYDVDDRRVYVSKENVRRYKEKGTPYRVSDNLNGNAGDVIHSSRSETVNVQVSGDIQGLNFNLSQKISSGVGYQMKLPSKGSYYMVYTAVYQVETGTKVSKTVTGTVLSRKNYTVKTPLYGEFSLRRSK